MAKRPAQDVDKPRDKPRDGIPGRNGGTLRNGGTNAGGPGRPPDEFKAAMRELATYAEKEGHIRAVLADRDHPQWLGALKYVTEHGYGKPTQTLEHTGKDGGPVRLTVAYEDEGA